jgi:hypothetical protein
MQADIGTSFLPALRVLQLIVAVFASENLGHQFVSLAICSMARELLLLCCVSCSGTGET